MLCENPGNIQAGQFPFHPGNHNAIVAKNYFLNDRMPLRAVWRGNVKIILRREGKAEVEHYAFDLLRADRIQRLASLPTHRSASR